VEFARPLSIGAEVSRKSTIVSVTEKTGSSGHLVFVDIGHETSCDGEVAVRETQTVVYRAALAAGAPIVPPPAGNAHMDLSDWRISRMVVPSETLLFRFSALTFNSHRIHYDLPYATREEGYRGLVVHGPLTATLLLDLAQAELGDNAFKSFSFRGLSPAICGEPLHLAMRGAGQAMELAAFAGDGRQVMAARASV
jgi:3-methylfumaryl-CoA hydratase